MQHPLSWEERAALRDWHVPDEPRCPEGCPVWCIDCEQEWPCDTARWLATLDTAEQRARDWQDATARAEAETESLAFERDALRAQVARLEAGLRNLIAVIDVSGTEKARVWELIEALRSARAALAAAQQDGGASEH